MSAPIHGYGSSQVSADSHSRLVAAQRAQQSASSEPATTASALAPEDRVTLSERAREAADVQNSGVTAFDPGKQENDSKVGSATSPFFHDNTSTKQLKEGYSKGYQQADALHKEAADIAVMGDGQHNLNNGAQATVSTLANGHRQVRVVESDGDTRTIEIDPNDQSFLKSTSEEKGFLGARTNRLLNREGTTVENGQEKSWLFFKWGKKAERYSLGADGQNPPPMNADGVVATREEFSGKFVPEGTPSRIVMGMDYGGSIIRTPKGASAVFDKTEDPLLTPTAEERKFKTSLIEKYQFTNESATYFMEKVPVLLKNPTSTEEGGIYRNGYIVLNGANEESALRQLGRAWYQNKVDNLGFTTDQQEQFRDVVRQVADNPNASSSIRGVARYFTYGEKSDGTRLVGDELIRAQNDTESMYSELAAAAKGDLLNLPTGCLRPFYQDFLTGANHVGP